MSAIVTEKFHIKAAKEFVESIAPGENDNFYLFIGRNTPWPNNGDANTSAIPTPSSSVSNGSYEYWRDMFALVRISANDVHHVVPRHNWTSNARYSMYDDRVDSAALFSNTTHPFYVVNSNDEVFKCLYNGRTNTTSGGAESVAEPDALLVEDITQPLSTEGNPQDYLWKYLYKVESDVQKFYTTDYLPVSASDDNLDPITGDVEDNGDDQYLIFNTARLTGNGSLYAVVVENPGSGYVNTASVNVTISGDGDGALASAVVEDGKIARIFMTGYGRNYSYATVSISGGALAGGNVANTATARAIISPRNSYTNTTSTYFRTAHAINLEQELGAKRVMIHKSFTGTGPGGVLPAPISPNDPDRQISYRRVGIVRNPLQYDANTGMTSPATANAYSTLTTFSISGLDGPSLFKVNELVWQESTNAFAVVVESTASYVKVAHVTGTFDEGTLIIGIGNGNSNGQVAGGGGAIIPATPEVFSPAVTASGTSAQLDAIIASTIEPYSGDILFVNHAAPVSRAGNDVETIRIVLTF